MNIYDEEELTFIFNSDKFKNDYENYKINNNKLMNLQQFINSIELNKNYYRLEMNNKFSKRYITDDTLSIKEIKSFLNKISDKNYDSLRIKILDQLKDKSYLNDLIIEEILNVSIINPCYVNIYVKLIKDIKSNIEENFILKICEKIYNNINSTSDNDNDNDSDYEKMCNRNKLIDKLIGFFILTVELEMNNLLKNKIDSSINLLIKLLKEEKDNQDNKYKYVQCLYNIFKSYYDDKELIFIT